MMVETLVDRGVVPGLILVGIPLVYGLAAVVGSRSSRPEACGRWDAAGVAASGALGLALLSALVLLAQGSGVFRLGIADRVPGFDLSPLSVRLDALTSTMLVLVTFVGLVIVRYSRRYLDGDPGQVRYVRWLLAALCAVSMLVVANNLLLLWIAWLGTSLALHQLLTFFADRPQALIAAHKKFIASRLADVCLLVAFALIARDYGSLELDRIFERLELSPGSPATAPTAGLLLATAAILKCALLPFHGWLIQVMEAPTPVSALLHAGVVNIGGFLMIRLAPLMVQMELAQTLLVIAGGTTAVAASLIMMTRVSVKVALAWSTCAQMGFMLLECGLGAYPLALLHLVAHSLYKAHAFLISGSSVESWRSQSLLAPGRGPGLAAWIGSAGACIGILAAVALLAPAWMPEDQAVQVLLAIVVTSTAPALARAAAGHALRWLRIAAGSIALVAVYLAGHAVFERLIESPSGPEELAPLRIGFVLAAFSLLFLVNAIVEARPTGALARALYPVLFAGLHLDEVFTRLTFRIWPARSMAAAAAPRSISLRPQFAEESRP